MKAVIHRAYGSPEKVLFLQEVEKPAPKDGEVLVRVRAASMHPDVWHVIVGYPAVLRLMGNASADLDCAFRERICPESSNL